ncbi:MAG: SRPBCC family protein [Actinobacteria bacterium]|nr:SRPBCC family protein [Actinomycetota bacterium]
MQLEHSFTVPATVEDAWRILLDIEQVAPCMPGAALDTVEGDEFTGSVKVKLGPIGLTYKGKASFVEKDEATHRAVLHAQGRDSRGNGTAAAKVTALLTSDDSTNTRVDVVTDLDITGKPAQFGRGVMADVGNKLIGQFADCLAGKLAGSAGTSGSGEGGTAGATTASAATAARDTAATSSTATTTAASSAASPAETTVATSSASSPSTATGPRTIQPRAEVEPIDLMASAGPAVAKRLAPVAAAVLLVLIYLLSRRVKH